METERKEINALRYHVFSTNPFYGPPTVLIGKDYGKYLFGSRASSLVLHWIW